MISRNWMIFSKEKWRNVSVHCGPPPHHPALPCVFLSISFCLLCTPCRNDFHSCWINEVLLNWEKARGVSTHKGTHTCTSRSKLGDTHTHTHTISTAEAIFKSASTLARRQWFIEARTLFGFFKKKKKIIFLPSQLKSVFYFQVNCRKCCKDESVGRQSQIKPSQTWGSVRFTCLYILHCRQYSAHDTHIYTNMSQAPELGPVTMVTHCCVY